MIAIGGDHSALSLKKEIMAHLETRGETYKDFGTYTEESCDYPDIAKAVCRAILSGECERGILICGTGIGISIAANKIKDCFSAKATREHNDSNILALGARVTGAGLALQIVDTWLDTPFSEGPRHKARIAKIDAD